MGCHGVCMLVVSQLSRRVFEVHKVVRWFACLQHPDLIEKRRKVFAERIARHFKMESESPARLPSSGGSEALSNGVVRQRSPLGRSTV